MGRMSKPPYQQRSHHLKLKQVYLLKVLPCCLCKVWMNLMSFVVFPVFLSPRRPCSSVSALLFVSVFVFCTFIVFFFCFALISLTFLCAWQFSLSLGQLSVHLFALHFSSCSQVVLCAFLYFFIVLGFVFFYLICFKAHLLVSKPSTHITEPYPIDFSAL